VARIVVPVVVDGVKERIALDFGGAARGLVYVVVFEGDFVVGAVEIEGPVLVAVAGGAVVAGTVDVGVGDCDVAGGFGA
jgi:hypothetical protein